MKITLRCLIVTLMLVVVGAAATPAAADSTFEVVQIMSCEMNDGVTEEQVEAIAADWLKAIKAMPGGAAVKIRVFFPAISSNTSDVDFYFVMNTPTYSDWGKIWDAYSDDSAAAKSEDLNQGKVNCANSELWEAHNIQ
jgi:hypothetical protein